MLSDVLQSSVVSPKQMHRWTPLNGLIGVVINNAKSTKEVRMQRIWDSVTLVNGTVKYCGSMENRMMVVPKIKEWLLCNAAMSLPLTCPKELWETSPRDSILPCSQQQHYSGSKMNCGTNRQSTNEWITALLYIQQWLLLRRNIPDRCYTVGIPDTKDIVLNDIS